MTNIPQTADAFKAWVDRECGKWPADLQFQAYEAWRAMLTKFEGAQETFAKNYRQWEAAQS